MDWELFMAICGGIVLIGNVIKLIYSWIKPAVSITKKVQIHDDILQELKEHDRKDYEAINKNTELIKAQCLCSIDIMNHMIDGNHVGKMKHTRDETLELLSKM